MIHTITVHLDSMTNRYWWVVVGKLNGADTTYSEARYTTENRARAAAWRYVRRWSQAEGE
jgi:hypothetical protein